MLLAIVGSLILGAAVSLIVFRSVFRKYVAGKSFQGDQRLDGKTVIVTGANNGIGKETAHELARRGARVILACRNMVKAEQAANQIKEETANENVIASELDLASIESIRKFADQINKEEERIDILINNAGVLHSPRTLTKDGFEMNFGVNHLGHFLLTNLLLDLLEKSSPSRVVNVSAHAHFMSHINFDDLMMEKGYWTISAYAQSKLANIMFTWELTKRSKGVYSFSLHPGEIHTNIAHSMPVLRFIFNIVGPLFFKTPVEGAQTTLYCALSDEVTQQNGKYFSNCSLFCPLKDGFDDLKCSRLWEISEKLVGLTDSRKLIAQTKIDEIDAELLDESDSEDVVMGIVNEDTNRETMETMVQSNIDDSGKSSSIQDVCIESDEVDETDNVMGATKTDDSDITRDIAEASDEVDTSNKEEMGTCGMTSEHDLEKVKDKTDISAAASDETEMITEDCDVTKAVVDSNIETLSAVADQKEQSTESKDIENIPQIKVAVDLSKNEDVDLKSGEIEGTGAKQTQVPVTESESQTWVSI